MEMGASAAIERQDAGGASQESRAFKEEDAPAAAATPSRRLAYEATDTQPRLIARWP